MSLIVVGTNHNYSPLALREQLSFSQKRLADTLNLLRQMSTIKAAVILSTCNRVEIYASCENAQAAIKQIEDFINQYQEISKQKLASCFYRYIDQEAFSHLIAVSCGLDSLVLGETQILAQVKQALLKAKQVGFMDKFLQQTFTLALSCAGKVQLRTQISKGKVSVPSIAIDFIKKKLGRLTDKTILIIGVGKVSELVTRYLNKQNPHVVFISNRTFAKAKVLAEQIKGQAVHFDELNQLLPQADVVICATASPHLVIKKEDLARTLNKELLIVDLALPHDVELSVKELPGVQLFGLEDLTNIIEQNKKRKHQAAQKAEAVIATEAKELWQELIELEQEPALWP